MTRDRSCFTSLPACLHTILEWTSGVGSAEFGSHHLETASKALSQGYISEHDSETKKKLTLQALGCEKWSLVWKPAHAERGCSGKNLFQQVELYVCSSITSNIHA